MSKEAKEFQKATADRIGEIFSEGMKEGKKKRVLLADEVGLGKTIIAREVIDKVRQLRESVKDDMYRVVYVCSNINIVHQNTRNLGMKEELNISESRLSMQHLLIHEKVAELKKDNMYRADGNYAPGEMPELLIPLTPGTSLTMTSGCGNINERALEYVILSQMPEMASDKDAIFGIFKYYGWLSENSWKSNIGCYANRVKQCGPDYLDAIHKRLFLNQTFNKACDRLKNYISIGKEEWNEKTRILSMFRMAFAQISIEELEPDFVIMDEFQRFSSLIDSSMEDKSEQGMLTKKFFGEMSGDKAPLILLLSATPYKPYTTLEELNENSSDQQYEDFLKLTDFLFTGEDASRFHTVWKNYSAELSQLSSKNFDVLLATKNEAENVMYGNMCRTERISNSIIDTTTHVKEVPVSKGDIESYCQMQSLLRVCKEKNPNFKSSQVPMDYVKSSPYLLSFMDKYQLKTDIMKVLVGDKKDRVRLPISEHRQQLLLKFQSRIYNYQEIPSNNARLDAIKKIIFNLKKRSYCLLWIPTSHPYYHVPEDNMFSINSDFSKILVFSSWEMVPRMLAFMLSYEEERLTIGEGLEKATYTNKTGVQRLRDVDKSGLEVDHKDGRSKSLFEYVSPYLASLYNPKQSFGLDIQTIREGIESEIRALITNRYGDIFQPSVRCSSDTAYTIARWLENRDNEELDLDVIPERVLRILSNMAIGSPAICLYRRLGFFASSSKGQHKGLTLSEVVSQFTSLFNLRQSAGIMDILYTDNSHYYFEKVLDYCVMGNMQAVLDEYIHMINDSENLSEEDKQIIAGTINDAFVGVSAIECTTYGKEFKKRLRTHYSMAYTNKKVDEKNVSHAINVRLAFNSPFHPFVLTTTSIGQEGLDFHWYCRKIVHWNIPSNPQDIEQREGRINRYKCLAIRRNLAKKYSDIYSWNDIFAKASKELGGTTGGLVPYWCLPVERFDHPELIERIIPMYPLSSDVERYDRMISVLALYRLTMGQPRQEELLKLFKGLSKEQVDKLLFNLSPIRKKHMKEDCQ